MITDEETDQILRRSFEYLVALMEFNMTIFRFQMDYFLYQRFKKELGRSFVGTVNNAEWDTLCAPNPNVKKRLAEVEGQIASITESLQEVERMNMRM